MDEDENELAIDISDDKNKIKEETEKEEEEDRKSDIITDKSAVVPILTTLKKCDDDEKYVDKPTVSPRLSPHYHDPFKDHSGSEMSSSLTVQDSIQRIGEQDDVGTVGVCVCGKLSTEGLSEDDTLHLQVKNCMNARVKY